MKFETHAITLQPNKRQHETLTQCDRKELNETEKHIERTSSDPVA